MSELALKRQKSSVDEVLQFENTNLDPDDTYTNTSSGPSSHYGPISMLGLTSSNKSGSFTVDNLQGFNNTIIEFNENHYSDAVATFSICGFSRIPEHTSEDDTAYGQMSCMPHVVGTLMNLDDVCTITFPIVFASAEARYLWSTNTNLYYISNGYPKTYPWADGDMTITVYFNSSKQLVFDWRFDGDVDDSIRAKFGTPTAETGNITYPKIRSCCPYINVLALIIEGE